MNQTQHVCRPGMLVTNVVHLHGEGGQQALLYVGEPRILDYHLLVTVPFMGHRHLPLTDGLCLGCCGESVQVCFQMPESLDTLSLHLATADKWHLLPPRHPGRAAFKHFSG